MSHKRIDGFPSAEWVEATEADARALRTPVADLRDSQAHCACPCGVKRGCDREVSQTEIQSYQGLCWPCWSRKQNRGVCYRAREFEQAEREAKMLEFDERQRRLRGEE